MSDVESFVRFCESEFGSAVMDREAAYIEQYVAPDDQILDVGCGIGSLEERFTDYDIVGIDISEAMVRTARQRTPAPFLVGDARTLPVRTDAVDAVVFVATLEFISEVDVVLQEATRVLRPGGRIVALILNTRSEYVQSNLQRDGSYFQQMVHRDSEALADRVLATVDGTQEYFLGIADETVVESSDPTTAAITAIVGSSIGDSK
ncbi:class I SAM-dependent methyltransferase [Haloplanus pelagicus]|uniref:class I SAM-dependent methyltransferase n=1 Tax=Haloplanus pelagicus TaxID=2949995 RepID=UPI00203A8DD8|nr:class I SAM-dependent methyltransferase [Haloplanus sp. HW8-1]